MQLQIENMRCEYLSQPIGIDAKSPRLSWVVTSPERGQHQTAFQILSASNPQLLETGKADLWDSGKVEGQHSVQIEYVGQPVKSRQGCWWKVRVWDKAGQVSPYSETAHWEMGLVA